MNSFFKDFFVYGFASVIGKIAAIFLIPIYTNTLTQNEYGAMALIVSCKGIIDLVSNLNIHSGIARDYYEHEYDRKKLISTGFISILTISLCVFLIILGSSKYITQHILDIPNYRKAFVLMALSIPTGSLMSYFSIFTRYQKRPVLFSIGILIQLAIQILISIVGVVVLKKGINSIFLGVLIGELFAVLYYAYLNKNYIGFSFSQKYLSRALLFALPTLPAILAGWADSSVGQIIVGRYISVEELAVYSLALQIASVFTLISTAFQNVWSPYLLENYESNDFCDNTSSLFSIFVILLLAVTLFFSILSPEIVQILSNEQYTKASVYFPLLCIPMSFYMLYPFVASGVIVSRQTKYVGIAYVLGSALNIISLITFIPLIGVIVVPASLTLSRISSFIILRNVSNKILKLEYPNGLLVVLVIVALSSCIINLYLIPLVIRLAILILSLLAIWLYIIKHYDIKKLYSCISTISNK